MGRLSDIVLRGLQFEAEQEARELENEGRRLQMDKIIREKVAVGRRMNPKFAESWDRFTNPETPTSELGKLMLNIPPEDYEDLINDRQTMLGAHTRNEFALTKLGEQNQQMLDRIDKTQGYINERFKATDADRDATRSAIQGRFEDTDKRIRELAEGRTTAAEKKAALAERNRRAGEIKEHQQQISLNLTTFPFATLAEADEDTRKILKKRFSGADPADVRKAIISGGKNAADLIRAGVDPEDAYTAVSAGITIKDGKVDVVPVAIPAELPTREVDDGPGEDDIEAAVEAGVANALKKGVADTPELREALRKRAAALLGGK